MSKPKTHAEYIASFPLPIRRKLKEMRALIREEAPDALESISYGVAAFSVDGPLVYIAGFRNHVSFFPTSSGIRAFRKELSPYKTSAGTVQFALDEPLPLELLRKMVRFRLREGRDRKSGRSTCDKRKVAEFDYSNLAPELQVLSKPAQRALVNAGLLTLARIARKTEREVLALHGIGPSSIPVLKRLLAARSLSFKSLE